MAKITKAQQKRLIKSIDSKAVKLAYNTFNPRILTAQDYMAIEKILTRAMNRIK